MSALVANARMYAVNASAEGRWREILEWVAKRAGVPLEVVDYRAPAPLAALWQRNDLGATTICGYPLASWHDKPHPRPVPIAAPVPSPAAFQARAVYRTDIVVRADSRIERVDDLARKRFGFTVEDSQSGYQAPRRFFAEQALARGGSFFSSVIGPLVTPRGIVEAILAGTIDAGPLDAYWHALLERHEPETAKRLRVVASTPLMPIPCFAAAAVVPEAIRARLAAAFVDAGSASELDAVRRALLLAGFEGIDAGAYEILAVQAREADALGYTRLL